MRLEIHFVRGVPRYITDRHLRRLQADPLALYSQGGTLALCCTKQIARTSIEIVESTVWISNPSQRT
jgi:hypothetical protein